MNIDLWIEPELERLRRLDLMRSPKVFGSIGDGMIDTAAGRSLLNFASNDYLGFSRHTRLVAATQKAAAAHGAGTGSSRLVCGGRGYHDDLERSLAGFKGFEDAIVFGCGYLANLALVTSLVGRGDTVYADKLVHASIIDAVAMSGARLRRFRHNDAAHAAEILGRNTGEGGRRLLITESVFSMDGDSAPLAALAAAAEKHDAMFIVDEAHATGVFGGNGRGLVAPSDYRVTAVIGTFSKALGGYGGFCVCSRRLKQYICNKSRPLIFTTTPPPAVVAAAAAALELLLENDGFGGELLARAELFRRELRGKGLDTGASVSQIVPVMIGEAGRALAVAARLCGRGVLTVAIRPPTVPAGTSRLRFSVNLEHSEDCLRSTAAIVAECAAAEGVL